MRQDTLAGRAALLALCAALFLSGMAFFPRTEHVFWATENFAARALSALALLLALLAPTATLAAATEGDGFSPAPRPRLGLARGLALLGLLALWLLVSTAFAPRRELALNQLGLWAAYPACFFAAWRLGREARGRARIFFFIILAGLFQAAYGLVQSAGLEGAASQLVAALARALKVQAWGFDRLNWAVSFGGRAAGFLGNPNFLGGHLALLLPLALAAAMDWRGREARGGRLLSLARWAAAALLLGGLVVTQTRGAWIGAGVGVVLFLYIARRRMPGLLTRNRAPLMALGLLGLLAGGAFLTMHGGTLSRLTGIFKGDEELKRRAVLVNCSLDMAARRPLVGSGPGNFRILFPLSQASGLDPKGMAARPYIQSEHSHNDLVQMAAEAGFPAALLLLALWAWLAAALWRGLGGAAPGDVERESQGREALLAAGVFGGLAALSVHGLANFPFLIAPTQMTAWALAALALRCLEAAEEALPLPPALASRKVKGAAWAALAALLFFSAWHAGRELSKDALWWAGVGEIKLQNEVAGREIVFKALEIDRKDERLWYWHGRSQVSEEMLINATGSLKEALRLAPHYHEAAFWLGKLQVQLNYLPEAQATLEKAVAEAPNFGDLYEPLGAAYFMQGKWDEAARAFGWAAYFNVNPASCLENQAAALGNLGRYKEALEALAAAERIQPNRAKTQVNYAITYTKMGARSLARIALGRARELNPNDPQIQQLSKALK
jgi:tetratricopeptide (TPR) repeat protein